MDTNTEPKNTHVAYQPVDNVDEDSDNGKKEQIHVADLHRSRGVLWLFFLYAGLVVTSWSLTCVLKYRPLPSGSYTTNYNARSRNNDFLYYEIPRISKTNHRWYQAAQVLQAIVTLVTLLIASAICSKSVVAFLQRNRSGISLRQAITLADQGWVKPSIYLSLLKPKLARARMTRALIVCMAITMLGAITPPLQQILVTQTTIKTPAPFPKNVEGLTDIIDILNGVKGMELGSANSQLTVQLSQLLSSTSIKNPFPNLWIYDGKDNSQLSCSKSSQDYSKQLLPQGCDPGQSYGNVPIENAPFVTQVSAFMNTGLVKQFLPRMNSSVTYVNIPASEFPPSCSEHDGAFFTEFTHNSPSSGYSIKACIPPKYTNPPWVTTRDRQDIQEQAFIRIHFPCTENRPCPNHNTAHHTFAFKIEANTTLGWFELPNYSNNDTPGPVLDKDPLPCHEDACARQLYKQDYTGYRVRKRQSSDNGVQHYSGKAIQLEHNPNIGPLSLTMLSLFGLDSWLSYQTALANGDSEWPPYKRPNPDRIFTLKDSQDQLCSGTAPLFPLTNGLASQYQPLSCDESNDSAGTMKGSIPQLWVSTFLDTADLQPALGAAVILASNLWLSNAVPQTPRMHETSLSLTSDAGVDTLVPSMALASIVVISILWALYLLGLFAMICYTLSTGLWTSELDAFTLLKMGAAAHDDAPLLVSWDNDKIDTLDELPGWFGDINPSGKFGEIRLGASDPIKPNRRYRSYVNHALYQ